ncbi:Chromatin remodeling protein SHL [Colletotrichum trifolii]|uniref:Chromatin remodeling protein SHL n=1 Tax=Colletotrichum trifolii TaxID=5466 RepID=A0A4R8RQB2_COLTR|nr:Chromatin remodeling protein SHL [Colletotrichum trifolii]
MTDTQNGFKQTCPFVPTGWFNRKSAHECLDLQYNVLPEKTWLGMTRYNSFVLNGSKFFRESFVYVANGQSLESQKIGPETTAAFHNDSLRGLRKSRSGEDWVAFILDIRASDKQHVFARIYWMYWPEELPEVSMDGDTYPGGRQSYHGRNELIASNHMDIINVTSVTSSADVQQWHEDNDEQIQEALYWRQALDCRTKQLSSVVRLCTCGQPANPDMMLIGCSSEKCAAWLHEHCLQADAVQRACKRLAGDHSNLGEEAPAGDDRPSDAKAYNISGAPEEVLAPITPLAIPKNISFRHPDQSTVTASKTLLPAFGKAMFDELKMVDATKAPDEQLFEAKVSMETDPPRIEIKVLGKDVVVGGNKGWSEPLYCLSCGSKIV